jgi:hypothetical protein
MSSGSHTHSANPVLQDAPGDQGETPTRTTPQPATI